MLLLEVDQVLVQLTRGYLKLALSLLKLFPIHLDHLLVVLPLFELLETQLDHFDRHVCSALHLEHELGHVSSDELGTFGHTIVFILDE